MNDPQQPMPSMPMTGPGPSRRRLGQQAPQPVEDPAGYTVPSTPEQLQHDAQHTPMVVRMARRLSNPTGFRRLG